MRIKPNQSYVFHEPITAHQILEKAAEILFDQYVSSDAFINPQATKDYLACKLGGHDREVFAVMMLDNQHQLIQFRELFYGTIDGASVYPREVVKAVLEVNAAAVIFAHNHPSGNSEPSQADKDITKRLSNALGLIDVRVLDHFVVGETSTSFAERGLL
ncbi:RadC family protein [Alkalimarinus sediminis]|uniref:DNA repair protein RadC n=1 Tax=Alkalimarinus sediminis TaxID=1632866 RepID=A0A9E8HGH9_9ALTE|nr:DNA repair protein RadC [Alkalimarinus sediminis]UZW74233.1 DNA repair protein RadC [Alkalimarinus sediminis]